VEKAILKFHRTVLSHIQAYPFSFKNFMDIMPPRCLITGVPVLINTSFNLRGEPIVCNSEEAISCFRRTDMDYLVLNNCVVKKQRG